MFHKRAAPILALIGVLVSPLGCGTRVPVEAVNDQMVYEALFLQLMGDAVSGYYIVNETENHWFVENPIKESGWEKSLKDLGGISIRLVKSLYANNENTSSLNWQPVITNGEILPSEYSQNPRDSNNDLCFVSENEDNIGVRDGSDRYFRLYYSVSRVAFSKNHKYALVKWSKHCAPLSGAGEFFATFEFLENSWKFIGGRILWIS